MSTLERLHEIQGSALERIAGAQTPESLDAIRVAVSGKKGELTEILRGMGSLSKEERPAVGKLANEVRSAIEQALESRKVSLDNAVMNERISADAVDITLPGRQLSLGSQHLIQQVNEEIIELFTSMGYTIEEGSQVETDYYNFKALNTPDDHPARGMQDTFYIVDNSGDVAAVRGESDVLLRTQTSGVQIHTMENNKPPIYMIAPGTVFRRDVADPSHLPQFNQIEGLVVDKGITFGDFKGTMDHVVRELFGKDRKTRYRPHFFPFTEPSCEVDVSCGICHGEGCRFCKNSGWIEVLGAGMVDPNVFGYVDIDPEVYTGFAFGIGAERVAALRYDLPDLRMLVAGDMRFLRQF